MKTLSHFFAAAIIGLSPLLTPFDASAATVTPADGRTRVVLSTDFVTALGTLGLAPAALTPAELNLDKGRAKFPITTGAFDLDQFKGEIDHSGGLSLTASGITVELSSFIIDLTGTKPRLTGLVVANDTLVGRLPLFNLDLSNPKVVVKPDKLKVSNVGVTLTKVAADALNDVFNVGAFTPGFPIGTADLFAEGLQ